MRIRIRRAGARWEITSEQMREARLYRLERRRLEDDRYLYPTVR